MTAEPLPRQPWETDADYQARIAAWEGSVTKERTPAELQLAGAETETQHK